MKQSTIAFWKKKEWQSFWFMWLWFSHLWRTSILLHNQIFEKYIIQPVWRTRPSFWNLQRITMFRNLNIFLLENFFKKIRNSICAKHGFVTSFFEKNIFFHTSFFYVSKPSSIRVDIVKYIRLRFKSYTLYLFIL